MPYYLNNIFYTEQLLCFWRNTKLKDKNASKKRSLYKILSLLPLLSSCQDKSNEAVKMLLGEQGLFQDVLNVVYENYVEVPDTKKVVQGALNGALSSLDEHSTYFTAEDYKIFLEMTKGQFGGIGAEVKGFKDGLEIVPIEDGPAHKAGLQTGDIIIKVNDLRISTLTPIQILQNLHGEPGTSLKLTILRDQNEMVVTVVRDIITVTPVKYELEDHIAYIKIIVFNEQTKETLEKAINDIKAKAKEKFGLLKAIQGVIIDLRNNPGGTLEQAVSSTSLFLEKGTIVNVKTRASDNQQSFQSSGPDMFSKIPIVILINKGSASASEIMASALHDNKRAILLGEKTYGKGSVQSVIPMKDKGAVKLTTAYFTTPNGSVINHKGIEPDITVEASTISEIKKNKDQQKQRAVDLLQGLSLFQGK